MKNKNIIAIAAFAAAGIATYFIRKRLMDRNRNTTAAAPGPASRHVTGVFAKAKAAANGQAPTP